jgi:regulator of protease activity HflC (stomatin/prohibitin superfamily)
MMLEAEGQAKAIDTVFKAIHEGNPDPQLLAYQYLQMLPLIAQGESNKMWIIPSELTQALGNIGGRIGQLAAGDERKNDQKNDEGAGEDRT